MTAKPGCEMCFKAITTEGRSAQKTFNKLRPAEWGYVIPFRVSFHAGRNAVTLTLTLTR